MHFSFLSLSLSAADLHPRFFGIPRVLCGFEGRYLHVYLRNKWKHVFFHLAITGRKTSITQKNCVPGSVLFDPHHGFATYPFFYNIVFSVSPSPSSCPLLLVSPSSYTLFLVEPVYDLFFRRFLVSFMLLSPGCSVTLSHVSFHCLDGHALRNLVSATVCSVSCVWLHSSWANVQQFVPWSSFLFLWSDPSIFCQKEYRLGPSVFFMR